jgi:hypothetical protein
MKHKPSKLQLSFDHIIVVLLYALTIMCILKGLEYYIYPKQSMIMFGIGAFTFIWGSLHFYILVKRKRGDFAGEIKDKTENKEKTKETN